MRLQIMTHRAHVPWDGVVDDEHWLLSWRLPEPPSAVYGHNEQGHFDALLDDVNALVGELRAEAKAIENDIDGMEASIFLEFVAERINNDWQNGPCGHHVVLPVCVQTVQDIAVERGSEITQRDDGVIRIWW